MATAFEDFTAAFAAFAVAFADFTATFAGFTAAFAGFAAALAGLVTAFAAFTVAFAGLAVALAGLATAFLAFAVVTLAGLLVPTTFFAVRVALDFDTFDEATGVDRVTATLDDVAFLPTADPCFTDALTRDEGVAFFALVWGDRFFAAGDFDEAFFAAMGVPWSGLYSVRGPRAFRLGFPRPNVPRTPFRLDNLPRSAPRIDSRGGTTDDRLVPPAPAP